MNVRVQRYSRLWWLIAPATILVLFLLGPIVFLFAQIGNPATLAGWQDPIAFAALKVSVESASISVIVMTLTGVPLGYILARRQFPGRQILNIILMIPLVFPPIISGILLLSIFGPYGYIGQFFVHIGYELDNTLAGIVLAQIFVGAPFVIVASQAAFANADPLFDAVARTLGAGYLRTFWQIDMPQALPGILAGIALAWLRSLGEYGATVVMSYHPYTLPIYTFVQLNTAGGVAATYPLALEALGASLGIVALVAFIGYMGRKTEIGVFSSNELPGNHLEPITLQQSAHATLTAKFAMKKGSFHISVHITARPGITVILGPSGAGKSLLLQTLAGILEPDDGYIQLGQETLYRKPALNIAANERGIGYVPQGYALFRHLSVEENIAFGLHAVPALQRQERIQEIMRALHIEDLKHRRPQFLSGGQAQRVALARAIVRQPRILLLDEPLSAIDPPLRDRLRRDLAILWRQANIPILLVTHDLADARSLADTIIIMHNGHVIQAGPRDEVLQHPISPQAAALVGMRNILTCSVIAPTSAEIQLDGPWGLKLPYISHHEDAINLTIQPAQIRISPTRQMDWQEAIIVDRLPVDTGTVLQVERRQQELSIIVPHHNAAVFQKGMAVWVQVPPEAIWVMPQKSQ